MLRSQGQAATAGLKTRAVYYPTTMVIKDYEGFLGRAILDRYYQSRSRSTGVSFKSAE